MSEAVQQLRQRIAELEAEVRRLKARPKAQEREALRQAVFTAARLVRELQTLVRECRQIVDLADEEMARD